MVVASSLTFTVEVDYTNRSIVNDRFAAWTATVVLFAETDQEAMLVAAQMVIGSISANWMVVATRVVDCIA